MSVCLSVYQRALECESESEHGLFMYSYIYIYMNVFYLGKIEYMGRGFEKGTAGISLSLY